MIETASLAYEPARTLDESINRRASWTPASRATDTQSLITTATLATIERALYLSSIRLALALDPFESTPTNAPVTLTTTDESEAA
jgi:hypothetical protein